MKKLFFVIILCLGFNVWAQHDKLVNAIEMDDISKVRKMIEGGQFSVNEKVQKEMPIISLAAKFGSEKVVQYLISKKADVNAHNSVRETALMMAVFFNDSQTDNIFVVHDRIARALIAAGANIENGDWWAPLSYAAYVGRLEIARYLVTRGALINGPVINNIASVNTPLMMASMQGHEDFVRFLLIQGADAKLKNTREATAYSLAEKYNHKKILKYLNCAMNLTAGETYKDKCE